MKKPIKFAGLSVILQIVLSIVLAILAVCYIFLLFTNSGALTFFMVIICILIATMGIFGVFFYNGFLVLGKKFGQKMLVATSYFFIVWVIIGTIIAILGLVLVHPIIKNKLLEFKQTMSVQKNLSAFLPTDQFISGNIDQMTEEQKKAALEQLENLNVSKMPEEMKKLGEENIQIENKLPSEIPEAISGIDSVEMIKNLIPQKTAGYIIVFCCIGITLQIIALLFAIGILKLADKVSYAKTTGILGIITNAGNILNLIITGAIFASLALPALLITFSIFSNIIGFAVGIVAIIFVIFQIILLFKASAELEK